MNAGRTWKLKIEGRTYAVQITDLQQNRAVVLVDGKSVEVGITQPAPSPPAQIAPVAAPAPGLQAPCARPNAAAPAAKGDLCAMMPGVVTKVLIEAGQQVTSGQVLLILEAMKMENEIRADREGIIARIHVAAGQQVQTGEPMMTFE
jgi:biotin carboxyl carrier protein